MIYQKFSHSLYRVSVKTKKQFYETKKEKIKTLFREIKTKSCIKRDKGMKNYKKEKGRKGFAFLSFVNKL